ACLMPTSSTPQATCSQAKDGSRGLASEWCRISDSQGIGMCPSRYGLLRGVSRFANLSSNEGPFNLGAAPERDCLFMFAARVCPVSFRAGLVMLVKPTPD